ncbi:TPA: hypothetical protein MB352_004748 [Klebsiella variicola subsp. variicola]|nr:hypothetical protein [Klebsiella variicola subsp. variicola]
MPSSKLNRIQLKEARI